MSMTIQQLIKTLNKIASRIPENTKVCMSLDVDEEWYDLFEIKNITIDNNKVLIEVEDE